MKALNKILMILGALFFCACVEDEPVPPPEMGESPVKINEAYSNGGRSTYGALDWVELYNTSDVAVDISGYVMYDKTDKSEKVVVPAGTTLAAHGFAVFEVDIDGGFGLGSGGDMVYLDDAGGKLIDQIEFGALTPEQSYARNPDGSETFKIQTPTPGTSNSGAVALPSVTNVSHSPASPTSDEAVTVTATVSAGEGSLTSVKVQWTVNSTAQTDLTMANSGDVYTATIPKQAANADVAYSVTAINSLGGTTSVSGSYTVRDATVVDYTGLVINEIDGNGKYIELYNSSAAAISLTGVKLVKNESGTWWTGGAVNIAAGGRYTIAQNGESPSGADEQTGSAGISPKQNLKFELKSPDDLVLDSLIRTNGGNWGDGVTPDYGSGTKYSYSRCPDGSGAFGLAVPSCGAPNPSMPAGPILTNGSAVNYGDLVINEIDGNGKFIEIFNKGTAAVSLQNVVLRKNESAVWWTGGAVNIAAGGYYAIAQTGQSPAGASEQTGASGISPKKTVKFEMLIGNMFIDGFARVKADGVLDADCTPDYGSGTKYSFSRCPDGTGAFGLAVPSCGAANPASSAGEIATN
ncbi:MAG: lamin tail domain-containing protein [Dysgonamonadaceae bacterium]|nr:lamin tail domain-containing protein [Dysgonamonadaceae bacterium]